MNAKELQSLREAVDTAMAPGPNKWKASQVIVTWFRQDPKAVVRLIDAAMEARRRPGGVNHMRLDEALEALSPVPTIEETPSC
ncbi:MAG TPA: hypothetical protein VN436_17875 [Holophaga sp.]|nr:hypothetical protein [Holophaga sp.]